MSHSLTSACTYTLQCFGLLGPNAGLPWSGKNTLKMKLFPGQGKVREFCGCKGNLERTLKVREKSRNLKINGYGRQASENLFILFKRGKGVLSHEIA